MGRWNVNRPANVVRDEGKAIFTAQSNDDADRACVAHNADCDAYEARIAELERLLEASADETRINFNGLLDTQAELARVKAESLRVVEIPDEGMLCDWYMTPTGLGYPCKDRDDNGCVETPEAYHDYVDCKPVRLERW